MNTALERTYEIWSNLEETFKKESTSLNVKTPVEFLTTLTGVSIFNKTSSVNYILQRLQESLDMSDKDSLAKYNFLTIIIPRCEELLFQKKLDNKSWLDINVLLSSKAELNANIQLIPEGFFENLFPIGLVATKPKKVLILPFKEIYQKYNCLGTVVLADETVVKPSNLVTPDIFCYGTNADLLKFIDECANPNNATDFKIRLLELLQKLNANKLLKTSIVFVNKDYLDEKRMALDTLGLPKPFKKTTLHDFDFLTRRVETNVGLIQVIAI